VASEDSPDVLWKAAEEAVVTGDVSTLERLLREHSRMFRERYPQSSWSGGLTPEYSGDDARSIIARNHDFENWAQFAEYAEAVKHADRPLAQFEAAVDAIVTGDIGTLRRLLRENPDLIRARSTRKHHSTLLHYVGANGVEGFRQKTPKNAVEVTKLLLDAGAEVDAVADMYRGTTTLGLVATSAHPAQAGVQPALIDLLLDHGASLDRAVAADYTHGSIVNACLANGRGEGAEYLANRGAPLDLEGAGGVGRLDVVKSFFNENGSLKAGATQAQMKSGFKWACGYGHFDVVEFLLKRGVDVAETHRGETGLHWAAYVGRADIVNALLERNASLDVKDESYGGTPLGWAVYGWGELSEEVARTRDHYDVVAGLIAAGAGVDWEWIASPDRGMPLEEKVRADPRMLAALKGEIRAK
jgi:hypothetical protein